MRLSDSIEQFIKDMLEQEETEIELKRNELASYFGCAPSQINYVLSTRFTPDAGYVIESHRGGGGYIRIVRVVSDEKNHLQYLIQQRIGDAISEGDAGRLLAQLVSRGALNADEAGIMQAAVSAQALSVPVPEAVKDALRARCLKTMLTVAIRQKQQNQERIEG